MGVKKGKRKRRCFSRSITNSQYLNQLKVTAAAAWFEWWAEDEEDSLTLMFLHSGLFVLVMMGNIRNIYKVWILFYLLIFLSTSLVFPHFYTCVRFISHFNPFLWTMIKDSELMMWKVHFGCPMNLCSTFLNRFSDPCNYFVMYLSVCLCILLFYVTTNLSSSPSIKIIF